MTIIVDLDHMLLNTELLKLKMQQGLEPFGVSKQVFQETYQQIVNRHDNKYSYDAPTHSQVITQVLKKPELEQDILKSLNSAPEHTQNFLYDDVKDFLIHARGKGASIIILTRGDDAWQNKKIDAAGLRKYVDRIVIAPESKGEVLRSQLRPDANSYFISDNSQEIEAIEGVPITMIQLLRPEGKYQAKAQGVPVCHTLNQVWDTIEKQSETVI